MLFKKPTAAALRIDELRLAELNLVAHQMRADYYDASVTMLKKRVSRLRQEIAEDTASMTDNSVRGAA